jgi:hypothetical protein
MTRKKSQSLTMSNSEKKKPSTLMLTFVRVDELSSSSSFTVEVFYIPEGVFDQSPFAAWLKSGEKTLILDLTMRGDQKESLGGEKTHVELAQAARTLSRHKDVRGSHVIMDDREFESTSFENEPMLVGNKIFYLRVISR